MAEFNRYFPQYNNSLDTFTFLAAAGSKFKHAMLKSKKSAIAQVKAFIALSKANVLYKRSLSQSPLIPDITREFRSIPNKKYVEVLLNSNKLDNSILEGELQRIYFDYLVCLNKGNFKHLQGRIEKSFLYQSEMFLQNCASVKVEKVTDTQIKTKVFENVIIKGVGVNREANEKTENFKYYSKEEKNGVRYFVHKF